MLSKAASLHPMQICFHMQIPLCLFMCLFCQVYLGPPFAGSGLEGGARGARGAPAHQAKREEPVYHWGSKCWVMVAVLVFNLHIRIIEPAHLFFGGKWIKTNQHWRHGGRPVFLLIFWTLGYSHLSDPKAFLQRPWPRKADAPDSLLQRLARYQPELAPQLLRRSPGVFCGFDRGRTGETGGGRRQVRSCWASERGGDTQKGLTGKGGKCVSVKR